ncbi:hypothetical protein [Streptomyces sp. AP-93]|uniref:hypothetical protein n=1 Tax=Streptomyces sp. AP-93 TaxID=2929048 RepID=UPI001FAFC3F6|nr:hypothetical protein [Streptomyces sp. AP-93]MCJ0868085.1 hypothetical protein [Streptomyces sp. AP-93]
MDTGQSTAQLPARVAWDEAGTVIVPNVLGNTRFEDIVAEAHERVELVTPHIHEHTAAHRDGSFASPVHCGFIPPGRTLEGLAFDKELLAALREATGIPRLIPRGGAVVLYEEGDFQGIHTDSVKSTVTVSIALTETLAPMGWAPHLRNAFGDQLGQVVADHGMFPDGDGFTTLEHPFADGSVRAFAGYHVPHWRAPAKKRAMLATMSFMDL